ncbi:MAG TPA: HAMP domain-containing sensor histidine kinase [Alphaproteobacteria bacterium]|nr:HAMP domain-containing sensor histidine kinase [Alphaproteobacteria bacterium]
MINGAESAGSSALRGVIGWVWRSLVARLVLLAGAFVVVPMIIYDQFQAADGQKQQLMMQSVRDRGLLISRALEPILQRADSIPYFRLGEELARFASGPISLKLLFRPAQTRETVGFFYIASAPPVSTDLLDFERQRLIDDGTLLRLAQSCAGDVPLGLRLELPGGRSELLTSITPVLTPGGCWALVVSNRLDELGDHTLGRPYWRSPEVQIAAVIYVVFAVLTLGIFFGLWRSLIRFGRTAREIHSDRGEGSFVDRNRIPELTEVAREFDRLVATLRGSAENIRRAAEDTAHAFKTPIGVIRQSVEPIRRRLEGGDLRGKQAVTAVESALDKLDGLVAATRRLDETTADLLDPPRHHVDLSALARMLVNSYVAAQAPGAAKVVAEIAPGIAIAGGADMIETIIENLVDNAISFSPPGGEVRVGLSRRGATAVLTIEDRGPGVPADRLERIFERYYSQRPGQARMTAALDAAGDAAGDGATGTPGKATIGAAADGDAPNAGGLSHFGIGLWLVRRNVEALGGRVRAENRSGGGLRVTVELPILRTTGESRRPT